jgi:hypothetical protein
VNPIKIRLEILAGWPELLELFLNSFSIKFSTRSTLTLVTFRVRILYNIELIVNLKLLFNFSRQHYTVLKKVGKLLNCQWPMITKCVGENVVCCEFSEFWIRHTIHDIGQRNSVFSVVMMRKMDKCLIWLSDWVWFVR